MGWGRGGGVLQAPPLEMQQISPVSSWLGNWEAWRRALHWQADEDTCLLPASSPGRHRTALASVKAPEHRQETPGKAAYLLTTLKETLQTSAGTCGSPPVSIFFFIPPFFFFLSRA